MTGEEAFYAIGWPEAATLITICIAGVIIIYGKRAPTINGFRDFVNVFNSRGGNILVLLLLTVYGLRVAMRFIYHIVDLAQAGKLDPQNTVIAVGVSFVTGSVFGLFSGALIKTMTGSEGGTPVPPALPNSTISTTSTTSVGPTTAPPAVAPVAPVGTE